MGVETVVAKEVSWLKAHERIVIVFLILAASVFAVNKIENVIASRDASRATVAEAALASQKATDAQLATQSAQMQAQYQAMVDGLTKQNAALSSAITARQSALQAQQGADAHLPVNGLATRIGALAGAPAGSVSSTDKSVSLTQTGAVAVAQTLEQVPVLQANLKDQTTVSSNLAKELDAANGLDVVLNKQVSALNLTIVDGDKACKAEVASVKAESRKKSKNWFLRGLAVGAGVTGFLLLHGV